MNIHFFTLCSHRNGMSQCPESTNDTKDPLNALTALLTTTYQHASQQPIRTQSIKKRDLRDSSRIHGQEKQLQYLLSTDSVNIQTERPLVP